MKKPLRIQRKRTKGWKMPENTVYVGRPSKWGNPYFVGENKYGSYNVFTNFGDLTVLIAWGLSKEMAIGFAIEKFKECLNPTEVKQELAGKNLACFCKEGEPCHADVLLKIANS